MRISLHLLINMILTHLDKVAGLTGLEPVTAGLTDRSSTIKLQPNNSHSSTGPPCARPGLNLCFSCMAPSPPA